MAGDKISPAPAVVDDLKNTRRLTRPVIMTLPPQDFFVAPRLIAAAAQFNPMDKFYDQTEASRKGTLVR
jgi:hypothetical protein